MPEIGKILIPTDFSEVARKAFHYGAAVAKACRADLLLTTVIEDPLTVVPDSHGSTLEKRHSFDESANHLRDWIPDEDVRGLNCDCVVKTGEIEDGLLEVATDNGVDLIVMGTHGRRRFKKWLLGSVADRLLRRTFLPVITVSRLDEEIESEPLAKKHVLYATDLSYGTRQSLSFAYKFARALDADLIVLHVVPPWAGILSGQSEADHRRFREQMVDRLERFIPEELRADPLVRRALRVGSPYQTILDEAEKNDVGLICVDLHGEHGMEQAVLGSTADRVIRGSHRPVLSRPVLQF